MIGQQEFKIGEWIFIQMKGFSRGETIISELCENMQNRNLGSPLNKERLTKWAVK
jgi:hypothetical protein